MQNTRRDCSKKKKKTKNLIPVILFIIHFLQIPPGQRLYSEEINYCFIVFYLPFRQLAITDMAVVDDNVTLSDLTRK